MDVGSAASWSSPLTAPAGWPSASVTVRTEAYYYLMQTAHMILQTSESDSLLIRLAKELAETPLRLPGSFKSILRRLLARNLSPLLALFVIEVKCGGKVVVWMGLEACRLCLSAPCRLITSPSLSGLPSRLRSLHTHRSTGLRVASYLKSAILLSHGAACWAQPRRPPDLIAAAALPRCLVNQILSRPDLGLESRTVLCHNHAWFPCYRGANTLLGSTVLPEEAF